MRVLPTALKPVISFPFKKTRPSLGLYWPVMRLKRVVFPAPLGPIIDFRENGSHLKIHPGSRPHDRRNEWSSPWFPQLILRHRNHLDFRFVSSVAPKRRFNGPDHADREVRVVKKRIYTTSCWRWAAPRLPWATPLSEREWPIPHRVWYPVEMHTFPEVPDDLLS